MPEDKKKPKRKHLHQVRIEEAHDGSMVSHHTYKEHRDAHEKEPEKTNVATHATPEEAGQAAAESFGQNAPPDANADPGAAPPPAAGGGDPTAGAGVIGQ